MLGSHSNLFNFFTVRNSNFSESDLKVGKNDVGSFVW